MIGSNVPALDIRRRLGVAAWKPPVGFGVDGWMFDAADGAGRVIVTCADDDDGVEWLHASMTRRDAVPSYDDLCHLRAAVFGDGWAYQVFAPPHAHINIHDNALHLFGRLDGRAALPDFTYGTGSI